MYQLTNHPLFKTLLDLKGNPRAAVYTEPMFGVPYNLFIPYVSVYMLALGLTDQQIGLLASISLAIQVFFALAGGAITDKFGRKRTLLVFDLLCWSIPCLVWAFAQNFSYFLVAAIFNSLWRVSHTAWTCLMVEDAEPEQIHHMWVWVYIAALGSAFVSPISGFIVNKVGVVLAMRMIYLFAFVVLTSKFILLYRLSVETKRGAERRAETRGQSLFFLMQEYLGVFRQLLRARATLLVTALMVVMAIYSVVNNTFWAILVTEKLGIPKENIAYFPLVRSIVTLVLFFWIVPRLSAQRARRPLAFGFAGFLLAQVLLVFMPPGNYPLLVLSAVLEACSIALVSPMVDAMLVLTMDPGERARLTAIVAVVVIIFSSPFGWIAGQLSAMNRTLPFVLNIGLFILGLLLVWVWKQISLRNASLKAAG